MNTNTFNVYVETVGTTESLFKDNVKAVDLDAVIAEAADSFCYITDIVVKLTDFD
tara:strand:- start:28465 stop:28629 length:165 start_codon:yes stop_codon:yes gene_type:complete